jgi:hypothetical protein
MTTWTLGQKVKSEVWLERKFERYTAHDDYDNEETVGECVWERTPAHVAGILIGIRSLQNGAWDENGAWTASGRVRAALIVTGLYRKPVRVPLDALEEVCLEQEATNG